VLGESAVLMKPGFHHRTLNDGEGRRAYTGPAGYTMG
jgi:hypothetical protein